MLTWIAGFLILIVKLTIILLFLLFMAAYLVWVERKFLARLQIRYGPNRAGTFGLLQPMADIVKMLTKEDTVPDGADKAFFLLAPAVVATTAFLMFSVVPFGRDMTLWGRKSPARCDGLEHRPSFRLRHVVSWRLWSRAGRLGVEFEVRSSWGHTGCGPDDQL